MACKWLAWALTFLFLGQLRLTVLFKQLFGPGRRTFCTGAKIFDPGGRIFISGCVGKDAVRNFMQNPVIGVPRSLIWSLFLPKNTTWPKRRPARDSSPWWNGGACPPAWNGLWHPIGVLGVTKLGLSASAWALVAGTEALFFLAHLLLGVRRKVEAGGQSPGRSSG